MSLLTEPISATEIIPQTLEQRKLGPFDWNASVLTLGGVKWDTLCSDAEAAALVHRAYELGVNTFDTAHAYGAGESERKLGLALEGIRDKVWVNTKTGDRTYDGAMREMELSLKRLRTDRVDLMFVHSVDDQDNADRILAPNSVLKAMEVLRDAGHIRHIGVSGHWVKHVMSRIIQEYPFEAVLFPVGLFNRAYGYSFLEEVLPVARERNMAVLGMKVYGAGRVKKARSVEPYLRYSLSQPIDTAVIGCDSISQLEETVGLIRGGLEPLSDEEQRALFAECRDVTQHFDEGEFDWTSHYKEEPKG
jgi:aryl-alcohol dehydrogenase-like predicted oxidoreductase